MVSASYFATLRCNLRWPRFRPRGRRRHRENIRVRDSSAMAAGHAPRPDKGVMPADQAHQPVSPSSGVALKSLNWSESVLPSGPVCARHDGAGAEADGKRHLTQPQHIAPLKWLAPQIRRHRRPGAVRKWMAHARPAGTYRIRNNDTPRMLSRNATAAWRISTSGRADGLSY